MTLRNKLLVGLGGLAAFIGIAAATPSTPSSSTSPTPTVLSAQTKTTPSASPLPTPTPTIVRTPAPTPIPTPVPTPKPAVATGSDYTNVDGNHISSPVQADSAPAGATAKCVDGTYSFSAHRSGTCSHHGGVAVWL